MKQSLSAIAVALVLASCSSVTIEDQTRQVRFSAVMPAWPWQDSLRAVERVNLSARTNTTTFSIRGLTEQETGATNLPTLLEAVVTAAVRAAVH